MRRGFSRVILVCTLLIAFTMAGWWPFEKKDDDRPSRRRGRRSELEEYDRVEEEWEIPDR